MTKRDYDLIAACFRAQINLELEGYDDTAIRTVRDMARRMASELLNTNPRFNMNRFLIACGVMEKEPTK